MTNVSGEILEPFSEEVRRALKKLLDSTRVPEELSHAISDLQHTANQAAMQSQFAGYDPDVKAALAFIEKCERARDELVGATYNSQHRPLTITDAAGQTSTFTYKNDKVISGTIRRIRPSRRNVDPDGTEKFWAGFYALSDSQKESVRRA